jgi:hypothetical protein
MEVDVEQRPLSLFVLLRDAVKLDHYDKAESACPVPDYSISKKGFLQEERAEKGSPQRAKRYMSQPKAKAPATMIKNRESPYLIRLGG